MRSVPSELLYKIISEVLEQQAFLFAESDEPDVFPIPEEDYIFAEMTFSGHATGTTTLVAPKNVAIEIAANILGMDMDDPAISDKAPDAFKELLNVICGHILSSYAGEDAVFSLSIPQTSSWEIEDRDQLLDDPSTLRLKVDEHGLLLRCLIDEKQVA